MNGQSPPKLFADLAKLFRRGDSDPIQIYLRSVQGRDRRGRRRADSLKVDFGPVGHERIFLLEPVKEVRAYDGPELAELIARKYNDDYWLLSLWNAMLRNASGSHLGIELVRAFVRHGVYLTAEDLYSKGTQITVELIRSFSLSDRVSFYKKAFDMTQILGCLRMAEKREIVARLRDDKEAKRIARYRDIPHHILEERLPEINAVLGGARIPEIARNAREQVDNLRGILQTICIQAKFWRDSKKLRSGLGQAIEV